MYEKNVSSRVSRIQFSIQLYLYSAITLRYTVRTLYIYMRCTKDKHYRMPYKTGCNCICYCFLHNCSYIAHRMQPCCHCTKRYHTSIFTEHLCQLYWWWFCKKGYICLPIWQLLLWCTDNWRPKCLAQLFLKDSSLTGSIHELSSAKDTSLSGFQSLRSFPPPKCER